MSPTPLELYGQPRSWTTEIYRKRFTYHLIVANQDRFRPDFMDWLTLNHHVWLGFEAETDRTRRRGFTHYSARTIWEHLRHETALREGPNELGWKINNNFAPDVARLYLLLHPDAGEYFELRIGRAAARQKK